MKKLLFVTTSLCLGFCALGLGGTAFASADTDGSDGTEFYPSSFLTVPTFDDLEDYAVGEGRTLFLQDNCIYEYGNERAITYENSRKTVTRLYFEDDFYYQTADGKVYALENFNADDNPEIEDFASSTKTDEIALNGYIYFFSGGELYVTDKNHVDVVPAHLQNFSNLKQYGDTVYAVKENVLYTLNGAEETPVKVEDFKLTGQIKVGGAYAALTSSASGDLNFVNLKNERYMTEVNLDKLDADSEYFETGDTVKIVVADTPTALLLYSVGNDTDGLSIIAAGGKTYLIHPANTSPKTVYALQDSEYKDGTITMGYVYSAPFESVGTQITPKLISGVTVKILGEVRKETNAELKDDFYLIEYADGEETVKGYVRFGLLSTFTFNEEPPQTTPDPDATFDDVVKPVVLILIVILLIAIAVGYIVYVGTSDKRKSKKTDKNGK